MRSLLWVPAATALVAGPLSAQQSDRSRSPRAEVERDVIIERRSPFRAMFTRDDSPDSTRAWLGIATSVEGRRDTLGLLLDDVVPGGPADKAGLREGERLTSINGVSLRVPPADADDPAMPGIVQRRLTRVLGQLTPGAEVELGVTADGRSRTVKVKTIAASEAPRRRAVVGRAMDRAERRAEARAVLGVALGGSPSRRDTAGVFVSGVTTDGPAEKAGIVEGDRLAAINGTDLRVAREDAGDGDAAAAKASRLQRVLADVKPGDEVELRVVSAGRSRTVKVRTIAASALAALDDDDEWSVFRMGPTGRGFMFRAPRPPMPPRGPDAPDAPPGWRGGAGEPGELRLRINGEDVDVEQFMRERVPGMLRQFRFEGQGPRVELRRERRITI